MSTDTLTGVRVWRASQDVIITVTERDFAVCVLYQCVYDAFKITWTEGEARTGGRGDDEEENVSVPYNFGGCLLSGEFLPSSSPISSFLPLLSFASYILPIGGQWDPLSVILTVVPCSIVKDCCDFIRLVPPTFPSCTSFIHSFTLVCFIYFSNRRAMGSSECNIGGVSMLDC